MEPAVVLVSKAKDVVEDVVEELAEDVAQEEDVAEDEAKDYCFVCFVDTYFTN